MKNLKTAMIKANGFDQKMYLLENQKDVLDFFSACPEQDIHGMKESWHNIILKGDKVVVHYNRNKAGFFSWCLAGKKDFIIQSVNNPEPEPETITEIQTRGKLTQQVKDLSKKLLGYEITAEELRLLPYIFYQLTNEQKIQGNRINRNEVMILNEYRSKGWILKSNQLQVTEEFWNNLCQIVFMAYVKIK